MPVIPELTAIRIAELQGRARNLGCCADWLRERSGSPIEELLADALVRTIGGFGAELYVGLDVSRSPRYECYFIIPQHDTGCGRVDFLLGRVLVDGRVGLLVVECDGHKFHERTPEQAERDRWRDRQWQASALSVFRFTGREIVRDSDACASEALDMVESLADAG